MLYGKIVAGLIGLLTMGPFGLVLGLFIGHQFDKGLHRNFQIGSPEKLEQIRHSFFETTFLLCGHVAKSDGRISQSEVNHTESIIAQMGLGATAREQAIALFRRGAAADFQVETTVAEFVHICGPQRQLQQTLLLFLISLAMADQQVESSEHEALTHIAKAMGYSAAQLEQLLRMVQAQSQFHSGPGHTAAPETSLADAYAALGVSEAATDKELKRAYRKLMSENHPDKLIAQGVPEEMVKLATEKSQDIQSAYERVRTHRGIRR